MTVSPAEVLSAPEIAPARYKTRDQLIGRFSIMLPQITLDPIAFEERRTDGFTRQVDEVALFAPGLLAIRSYESPPDREVASATDYSLRWLIAAVEPSVRRIKAKYSFGATPRSDEDDFEQIMRDHMITKLLPAFDVRRARFLAFFERAAEARVIDRVRKERVATRFNGSSIDQMFDRPDSDNDKAELLPVSADDAHPTVLFHERTRLLAYMLNRKKLLSPEQRQAYVAVVLNGATEVEYAEITGVPLGTIKSRVRSARLRIIRKMELLGHHNYVADIP